MPLTVADWARLTTDEKGRLRVMAAAEAMRDPLAMPLLDLLPFVPSTGGSYTANYAAASLQAATRAINSEFAESTPTVDQFNFPFRAAGGELKIDINLLYGDNTGMVRAGLLTQKFQDVAARLFRLVFRGDKDAASGDQFAGIDQIVAAFGNQVVAGANGAKLTAAMLDLALRMVPGANIILCNRTMVDQIDALDTRATRTVVLNQGNPTPGMYVPSYKGIPIMAVQTAPNDSNGVLEEILPFSEAIAEGVARNRATIPGTVARNTAYAEGDWAKSTSGAVWLRCKTAGTTHATTEPTWGTTQGAEVTDGTAVFVVALPQCTRVTVARIGLNGIYGRQVTPMTLAAPRVAGAFEYNDMNWFMAPIVTDHKNAVAQVVGVKES